MQVSNLPVAQSAGEQNAVPCSGGAVNSATAGVIANSASAPTADREKRKSIQLQLVLLLHARKCRRNAIQSGENPNLVHCPIVQQ
ncbi:hypothetical protein CEXT_806731 [Caerostris extrusa]|uniref:Uncharacterized protein n=1 Tax=Caerostris extrusa TaxID=172846 RepID=A0AAV4Q6J3_CAEEX|nr:hypothetical protein CEXT_806731 [Caerostris extrusa]